MNALHVVTDRLAGRQAGRQGVMVCCGVPVILPGGGQQLMWRKGGCSSQAEDKGTD